MEGTEATAVRLIGLERLDTLELGAEVPAKELTFEEDASSQGGTSYEPATLIAVVLLTTAAIKGLSAWLLKKRHHGRVTYAAETVNKDGSRRSVQLTIELSESTTQADVVKALGDALDVDVSNLPA